MDADANDHLDEGTIHAWLDDALPPAEAARIAEHVRGCAECSARVAEARGLIAGASRIVGALDDVPGGSRPAWSQEPVAGGAPVQAAVAAPARAEDASLWRRLRVTPTRAAIAATLIVAVGITLTRQRVAIDTSQTASRTASAPMGEPVRAPSADSMAGSGAAPGAEAQSREGAGQADHLLDSAVAKSLAMTHPPRAFNAAPGAAIPQAPVGAASASVAPDTLAGLQVAAGRSAIRSERVLGAAERADKARVGAYAPVTPATTTEALDAARVADQTAAARKSMSGANMAQASAVAGAKQCYLVEGRTAGASWGGEPLPLIVVADSAARAGNGVATVLTGRGAQTSVRARWVRLGGDSLSLALSRTGYGGVIALGPELAGGRAGVARSGPPNVALEQVATRESRAEARKVADRDSASGASSGATQGLAKSSREPAPAAAPLPSQPGAAGVSGRISSAPSALTRDVPVTMRPVVCPAP
jgi:hypothetical protein